MTKSINPLIREAFGMIVSVNTVQQMYQINVVQGKVEESVHLIKEQDIEVEPENCVDPMGGPTTIVTTVVQKQDNLLNCTVGLFNKKEANLERAVEFYLT